MSAKESVGHRVVGSKKAFPELGFDEAGRRGIENENSISPMKKSEKVKKSSSVLRSVAPKSRSSLPMSVSPAPSLQAPPTSDLLRHYYSDDDEFDQFTSQRINVKESSELLILNSPERAQLVVPLRKNVETSNNDLNNTTTKKTHYITIVDYEFDSQTLTINHGDSIEFRLSVDVPLHAEHQLRGISSESNLLKFESPLLQQEECTRFVYTPKDVGTLKVQCCIYPDMVCNINIKDSLTMDALLSNTPPKVGKFKSSKSDIDTEIVPYNVSITQTYFDCYRRLIEDVAGNIVGDASICTGIRISDSHTGVGEKDYHGSMGYTSSHDGTSVCDSDDSATVAGDTAIDTPVRDRKTVKKHSKEITNEKKLPTKRVVSDVIPVIVRDFEFHPKELDIVSGTRVKFIFECNSSQKLYCEGQFEGISLDSLPSKKYNDGSFSHDFWDIGTYSVSNEVFSFMLCTIRVNAVPITGPTPKLIKRREIKKLDDITEMNAAGRISDDKDMISGSQESLVVVNSDVVVVSEADLRRKQRNKKKRDKKKISKELKLLGITSNVDCTAAAIEEQNSMKEDRDVCCSVENVACKNENDEVIIATDEVIIATSDIIASEGFDSHVAIDNEVAVITIEKHEEIKNASVSTNISLNEEQIGANKNKKKNKKKNKQLTVPTSTSSDSTPMDNEVSQSKTGVDGIEQTQSHAVSKDVAKCDKIAQYYEDIEAFMCGRMTIVRGAYHSQGYELTASLKKVPIIVYNPQPSGTTAITSGEGVGGHHRRRPYRSKASKKGQNKTNT